MSKQSVEHHKVAIIGTGFSGLGMAIRLKQQGENDFIIFEKEAGVGGTWRVNHYPGCACDVPSHLYSFSFAPNPNWSRMFAPQPEIKKYLEYCASHYDVLPHVKLNNAVTGARWNQAEQLW
ncbi:flavin-containing monooxygenase, partial [Alcanivorax jadensis]|uniref:flavin-containing monooxygenase n=1 Tax=Alcanivorax jadensis TaxID=64988 RepID=UPI00240946F8